MMTVEALDNGTSRKVQGGHGLRLFDDVARFRGVEAVRGIEKLTNPRGFVVVDKHQQNPAFPNVFCGSASASRPRPSATPVPVGVPKTCFMIKSMVTATATTRALLRGKAPTAQPT
ncbi:hypothetical protein ACU4GH_01435 [Bradyrhizobium betae]